MAFDSAALRRDIDFLISDMLSADAQKMHFVAFARDEIAEFEQAWQTALKDVRFRAETFVDGRRAAALEDVDWPGGVILARARGLAAPAQRAVELLNALVKVKSGRLKRSLAVYGDGQRIDAENFPVEIESIAITYLAPYFRKGEREGWNVKSGAEGGQGLISIVAQILKREFRGAPFTVKETFRNFADAEIEPRKRERRRSLDPTRLPALLLEL